MLSCVQLFATPWATVRQDSLSITSSRSLLKFMSIKSEKPSNHLILVPFSSCRQSFPASGSLLRSQSFASGGQSIGASASASVLPMTIQNCFPLGLTGLISLQSKGLSRVFSNQIRSDEISRSVMSDSLRPHESQHARPPCPSPTPGVHSDSRPSSQ